MNAEIEKIAKLLAQLENEESPGGEWGPNGCAIVDAIIKAASDALTVEREACVSAVSGLAEDKIGDLEHDWSGGWEAAIESAVEAIRARSQERET